MLDYTMGLTEMLAACGKMNVFDCAVEATLGSCTVGSSGTIDSDSMAGIHCPLVLVDRTGAVVIVRLFLR